MKNMIDSQKPPFQPGEEFTLGNATYKVKAVKWLDYDGEGKGEWFVIAWRFIKTTQKFSGAAYSYRLSRILNK